MNQATSERISDMIIDASNFEEAVAGELKGREAKEPVDVPADLEKAFEELTEAQQQSYRRAAEVWWPPEKPEKLPGETRATHALRTEAAEVDRQTMLDRDQVKAFKQARTPHKLQELVGGMAAGVKEQAAALRQAAEAQAQEEKQLLDAQRERARRESGGLGGGCRQL